MTLRDKLADLIRASGRTQSDLAVASGVPQPTISSLVTGARGQEPRAELVTRLCRGLGLSASAVGLLLYECYPAARPECD